MSILIENVMTRNPTTLSSTATFEDAKQLMYRQGIRHLPVVKDRKLFGILSDRDVKLAFAVDQGVGSTSIEEGCNRDVFSVQTGTPVREVCAQMVKTGYGSVVVIDISQSVIGIFTAMDACKIIANGAAPTESI